MALSAGARAATAPQLYRGLLRACGSMNPRQYGHKENNLWEWVVTRFRSESFMLQQRLTEAGDDREEYDAAMQDVEEAEERCRQLIDVIHDCQFIAPGENPALFSCFAAAQYGAGNPAYARRVEDGLLYVHRFADLFRKRMQEEEERGNTTKNRAMQAASLPYARILTAMEMISPGTPEEDWQQKLAETNAAARFYFYELPDIVAVETVPGSGRQTIYIRSIRDLREVSPNSQAAVQEWICQPPGVKFEQDAHLSALRVLEQLKQDGCLDPSFSTYISGHSAGGAIAVILGCYLEKEGHDVQSVITFGQPKVTTAAHHPDIGGQSLLRITASVDAYVNWPPVATETNFGGGMFVHYGEELKITPRGLQDYGEEFFARNQVYVTMAEYLTQLEDTSVKLEYSAAPEVDPRYDGFRNFTDAAAFDNAFEFDTSKHSRKTVRRRRTKELRDLRGIPDRTQ